MFRAEVTKDDIQCIRIDKGYGSLCYTQRVRTIVRPSRCALFYARWSTLLNFSEWCSIRSLRVKLKWCVYYKCSFTVIWSIYYTNATHEARSMIARNTFRDEIISLSLSCDDVLASCGIWLGLSHERLLQRSRLQQCVKGEAAVAGMSAKRQNALRRRGKLSQTAGLFRRSINIDSQVNRLQGVVDDVGLRRRVAPSNQQQVAPTGESSRVLHSQINAGQASNSTRPSVI